MEITLSMPKTIKVKTADGYKRGKVIYEELRKDGSKHYICRMNKEFVVVKNYNTNPKFVICNNYEDALEEIIRR